MPKFSEKKILPHSAKKLYSLVMDIEKYPEFLPWCKSAKIIEIISADNLRADLLINFKGFFEKYRSDVKHGKTENGDYFVDVVAIEGPFKKLINQWKITDLKNDSCEIEFFIDFEFNSVILSKVIGVIFEKATHKMMSAFEDRASAL
ncbi:MAG: type II toxin-antitoxin system RatA family toxin [Proteobacteria bacterium]|nr:type II toxin-antitoxin system RatA family toxin [Pseudomonadota bacterium]